MALYRKPSPTLERIRKQQEELAAQLKAAEREEREEQRRIRDAGKRAGESYAEVVLPLYDLLGVEPEHTTKRTTDERGEIEVTTDPKERIRAARVLTMLEEIIEHADKGLIERLRREDAAGREERRREREAARATKADADEPEDDPDEPEGSDEAVRSSAPYEAMIA
ncbi:hypothetical protein GCM10027416_11390 [Okibacterium endophyticum]